MGEGLGSYVSIKKVPKVHQSTGELGGDFPRFDGCMDKFVTRASLAAPTVQLRSLCWCL